MTEPPGIGEHEPALPPRQVATRAFPVVGEREPEPFDDATWTLEVGGRVKDPAVLTWADLVALPRVERRGAIHCVTRWSRPDTGFRGVPLSALLDAVRPRKSAAFVRFASGRRHDTTLPLELARDDVLVALELATPDGWQPLAPQHGGPVRTVVFARYLYKSVKWLRTVELLKEDRLGTWERTAGYHNGGDPWTEERYVVRELDRVRLGRAMAARDLAGLDLLGAALVGADLAGFSLEGATLRNADLRRASLAGADLRGANLTNADLRGADLTLSRIDGTDLDGADLRGADLSGAGGVPASVVATTFAGADPDVPAARVTGLRWPGIDTAGLADHELEFLRVASVIAG